MNKSAMKIAGINLRNIKAAYLTVGIIEATQIIQGFIYMLLFAASGKPSEGSGLSTGNILWLIPLMSAILIPTRNFKKTMNLGGKRVDFVRGCLGLYVMLAFFGALANTVIYFTLDRFIQSSGVFSEAMFHGVMNVTEIFGWAENGAVIAFFQQFAFLLMVTLAIHTLVSMQDRWYGWATDAVIAAIVSVCTPIASLRPVLTGFFGLVIFNPSALLQIIACLMIAIAVYMFNKPIFSRKII